jgi:hypothetical protein
MMYPFKFRTWDFRSNQMIKSVVLTDKGTAEIISDEKHAVKLDVAILFSTGRFAAPATMLPPTRAPDKVEIYVGDIIHDCTDRGPMVCVAHDGAIRFLFLDVPNGNYIIGTPWDDIWHDRATLLGNIFEHPGIIDSPRLLESAMKKMQPLRPNANS